MKKVRILALAVVAALLLIFPAIVMGQPVPDHLSRVMVMLDGEKVPDDTDVTAMIDGEDVAIGDDHGRRRLPEDPRNGRHHRHGDQFHGRRHDGHGDRHLGAGRTRGKGLRD